MDALKEEKEGLEELIANNQEKIEDLQTKVTQLESTLETYSTTKNNLEEERNRLIQQISFFENQDHTGSEVELKSLTDKLNHLETINSDLNRQMESYSLNMNSLEEERNRLIQQITEFESQQSNGNVDLREKLSLLETTNQDLIRQLEELKAIPKPDQVKLNTLFASHLCR
jgi:chromosome segregation ATPase